ncbi:MAG TPA: choice-of-anchor Q domain-containing protein [Solirubrobacterales bacterium]|nr:choice-of-anchor Q domain-containing protein [Solirubrobacterales bacterium]
MRRLVRLLALLAVAGACLPVSSASALSYPVTSTADGTAAGTLRWAIAEANNRTGADSIPIGVTGTIDLKSALPVIFDPVSITGPGAGLLQVRRDAVAAFPVFVFASDANPSSLAGVTVSNGQDGLGAGITNVEGSLTLTGVVVSGNEARADGAGVAGAEGGGIFSMGPLTLRESVVAGNVARAGDGTSETLAAGGGVVVEGPLTMERSTISGNVAEATGGTGLAYARGGGLVTGAMATIELSTISGNVARAAEGGTLTRAQGGGLDAQQADITGSTLAGNAAHSDGEAFGANLSSFSATLARNTLVAYPEGDAESCNGLELASGGYNLDEDGSCGFGEGSDLVSVVAGLDPVLRDNGGPTPTHALLPGSIAIDRGRSFGSGIDQRGLPRPSDFAAIADKEGGDGSDIGAFELQAPPPSPVLVSVWPGDRVPPNTRIVSGPPRSSYKRVAKFRFASTEPQSTFQCKLDKRRWRRCRNPFKRKVRAGAKHLFRVRAIDRFGNVDPTPARFGWRVKKIVP